MLIEIAAPASLPLGLVRFEDKTCLLGLTVQHPPVNLFAGSHSKLQISGPRADKGHEQAVRFLDNLRLKPQAQVEIEYAVPMFVGLGSEASLGLSIAKALAWIHNLPAEQQNMPVWAQALGLGPSQGLEYWGFDQGGLLLVDAEPKVAGQMPGLLRRREIEHTEKEAWSLVFYFPNVPDETPETLEADRLTALLQAAPHLSKNSGRLVDEKLWPAVASDDIELFGQTLLALQQMNEAALTRAGTPLEISTDDQAILDLMRASGAVAWGQNLTGLSFYGLVKGGQASRELRKKVRAHVGFFGGIVLATITDNRGVGEAVRDENLA
jgi:predicted sugar kinase